MNNPSDPAKELSRDELTSALFANLIMQQTNMALMFMGRIPHPETGKAETDLEAAKFFIDQLEMIEVKTKGNLNGNEDRLLKQSLTTLRMAYVEAVERPPASPEQKSGADQGKPEQKTSPDKGAAPSDESHKKFTKKY